MNLFSYILGSHLISTINHQWIITKQHQLLTYSVFPSKNSAMWKTGSKFCSKISKPNSVILNDEMLRFSAEQNSRQSKRWAIGFILLRLTNWLLAEFLNFVTIGNIKLKTHTQMKALSLKAVPEYWEKSYCAILKSTYKFSS